MTRYSLHSALGFGKHQGKTLAQIMDNDAQYLVWAIKNLNQFNLDAAAAAALCKRCPYQQREIIAAVKQKNALLQNHHVSAWEQEQIDFVEALIQEQNDLADALIQQQQDEEDAIVQQYLDDADAIANAYDGLY